MKIRSIYIPSFRWSMRKKSMRFTVLSLLLSLLITWLFVTAMEAFSIETPDTLNPASGTVVFVIHGGAGTIERSSMTPEREKRYRDKLEEALKTGYGILKGGGHSLDAVEAAINLMENSGIFNAGRGAVFTNAGTNELDAAIMDGATLKAGAVAGLRHIKNPISLARMVMERSPHVMMAGAGAEAFAQRLGVELVDQKYFYTEERWKALQKAKELESQPSNSKEPGKKGGPSDGDKHGTVGAVALDNFGNLAAGTSTGGITNKKVGRIGDSPVIGAGTYANNRTCAVSATGDGEYFIRSVVAYDVSAMIEYKGMPLREAGQAAIDKVGKLGGGGGLIAIDKDGNVAMPFNTPGMYRGYIDKDGKIIVEIYR
jgi:beta-aspartyl-peptidase (threonine type)